LAAHRGQQSALDGGRSHALHTSHQPSDNPVAGPPLDAPNVPSEHCPVWNGVTVAGPCEHPRFHRPQDLLFYRLGGINLRLTGMLGRLVLRCVSPVPVHLRPPP
jgi:hypothetical protein